MGHRYLGGGGSPHFQVDEAKIAEDARYDGKWVLRTNTELGSDEVALQYKQLWMMVPRPFCDFVTSCSESSCYCILSKTSQIQSPRSKLV